MRRVHAALESLQRVRSPAQGAAPAEHATAESASDAYLDVREPLDKIAALVQLLIANRARLDDEDRLLLEEMVASSRRLHWLIDTVAVYERLYGAS
jgi:light-regulated signal transduction histidine kinase (bacteriophytochrome)